jgi:hypothetical protein
VATQDEQDDRVVITVFLRVSGRYVVVRVDDIKECQSLTFARPFLDPQASGP